MLNKKLVYICALVWPSISAADQITRINNQIPTDGIGATYISGFSFFNKKVTYEKKNELAVFEGDIILGTTQEAEAWQYENSNASSSGIESRSIIITGKRFRWINNLVPFQFGANVPAAVRNMVLDAMDHWRDNTAIEFIERNSDNETNYPDFVRIVSDDYACWSQVGRRGGRQDLNVVEACGFGATVHEIGHTVGLWHEQSREDRNNFIQINWKNIQASQKHNFNQHINDGDDVGEYDYGSIMHYGQLAFSINGQPTITPLQPVEIGQRDGLSELDIASIFKNYPEIFPVAKLDKSIYSIFLGNSVLFDARQSFDPDGAKLRYIWSFGDGREITTTAATLKHVYENRGTFNLSLTVTDPDGHSDTDTAKSHVYGVEALIPPINLLLL